MAQTRAQYAKAIRESIGPTIRKARENSEMTQAELARNAGVSISYISMIERGERNAPIETLASIAWALDLDVVAFF